MTGDVQVASDAALRGQLEAAQQEVEAQKLEVARLVSDAAVLEEQVRSGQVAHSQAHHHHLTTVTSLKADLSTARAELEQVTHDFNQYKVRVHTVLKQQHQAGGGASHGGEGDSDTTAERLTRCVEQLKTRLSSAEGELTTTRAALDQAELEHDRLMDRHTKVCGEMDTREKHWLDRQEKLMSDHEMRISQLTDSAQQLQHQNEQLTETFRTSLREAEVMHEATVERLHQQLAAAENDIFRLTGELQQAKVHPVVTTATTVTPQVGQVMHQVSSLPPQDDTVPVHHYSLTRHLEEREQGEGQETSDVTPDVLPPHGMTSHGMTSLQELLDSSQLDEAKSVTSFSGRGEVEQSEVLKSLSVSERKVSHLSELLSESEAAVSGLTEQAKVLKEEIRRLERNTERTRHTEHMEYLKNVFIKFLTLPSSDERHRLVPVLTTMLKLSPDESHLVATAAGDEPESQNTGGGSAGWSAYLHRWGGMGR